LAADDQHHRGAPAMSAMFRALHSMERGDRAAGEGWMSRMKGSSAVSPDAAEHGYPLSTLRSLVAGSGDFDSAMVIARPVQDIRRRFDDPNLVAVGFLGEGRVLIERDAVGHGKAPARRGNVRRAVREATPGMDRRNLLPPHGYVCPELFDIRRACEWTEAGAALVRTSS
jgi:hypothetical protein